MTRVLTNSLKRCSLDETDASVAILAQELSLLEARSFPQAHHTRHKDQNRRTMVPRAVVQLVLVLAVCQAMKPRMMREDDTSARTEIGSTGTFRRVKNWVTSFVSNTGTSGEDTRMDTKDAENDRPTVVLTKDYDTKEGTTTVGSTKEHDTKKYNTKKSDTKEYDTEKGDTKGDTKKYDTIGEASTIDENGLTSLVENSRPNDDDTNVGATKEYDPRSATNDKEHHKEHTKGHDKEYDQWSTPTTKEYTKEHDKVYDQWSDDTKEYHNRRSEGSPPRGI